MNSFPVLKDIYSTLKNWSIKLTTLLNDFQTFLNLLIWRPWTPVFSANGSMTFTVTGVEDFKYINLFGTIFFTGVVIGTTGGTASDYIAVSLPFPIAEGNQSQAFNVHLADGGAYISGFGSGQDEKVHIHRYDGANWGLGTNREFRVSGFYKRR